MGVLIVLLWKHFKIRVRRFIHTPLEYLWPLLMLASVYGVWSWIGPELKKKDTAKLNIYNTETLPLDIFAVPSIILYTPKTQFTDELMDNVGFQLKLPRLHFVPSDTSVRGYYPFDNEGEVEEFVNKMGSNEALVKFENLENNAGRLNYTIRMKTDFMTHIYESLDELMGPHQRFGAIYEPFMRLQWAIDSAYIQLKSNKTVDKNVYIQEFPYAEYAKNDDVVYICAFVSLFCALAMILPFVFMVTRLLTERASGVQELIKMTGVSNNMIGIAHFINALPGWLFFAAGGTLLLKITSLIPESNAFLIFIMLTLYFVSMIAMAFLCSYITNSAQYASALPSLIYMLSWLPARLLPGTMPRAVVYITGLLPHIPMYWFWNEVGALETHGNSVNFSTMSSHHLAGSGSVLGCFIFLVIQTLIFFALTWYLSHVRPGKHARAKPCGFLFQKQFWTKKKVTPDIVADSTEEEQIVRDEKYFEEHHGDVGIKIVNVSKMFKNDRVLNNVTFDVYKGEITVLLGHNGAGKTTLMSIITGILDASGGKVYVNGLDTTSSMSAISKQIGYCPQHNLFFSYLTVLDHVMLFALLKGYKFGEARKSALALLAQLELKGKANDMSDQLSGGMKRRLQLACALTGNSSVLILDEPTSGLDVETRRELWDLMLSLRGSRTVLLTTHFMEEADALGDRVAALHGGQLRCHATPMFLKKSIGTGYRLSLTTAGLPNEAAITAIVTSVVPNATVKEQSLNSIDYSLPAQDSQKFPQLFSQLEDKRSQLGIETIGVGVSTLEEVFIKLCSDVTTTFTDEDVVDSTDASTFKRLTGCTLWMRQFFVLLKRQFLYIWSSRCSFLILQFLLPVFMIVLFTYAARDDAPEKKKPNQLAALNLDLYEDMPERRVLYDTDDPKYLSSVRKNFPTVKFQGTSDVAVAVLRTGEKDALEYRKYLAGVELNKTSAKVLYTTTIRHAAPVGLNLLSNMLATQLVPGAAGWTITTNNHPLPAEYWYPRSKPVEHAKIYDKILIWAIIMVMVCLFVVTRAVSLPCRERLSGTRRLHVLAGCPPLVLWLSPLLALGLVYCVVLAVPTVLAARFMDNGKTFTSHGFILVLFLVLNLGMLAFLAQMFLVSFSFGERGASAILFALLFISGGLLEPLLASFEINKTDLSMMWRIPLYLALYTMPASAMTGAVLKTAHVARFNTYCELNRDRCPNLPASGYVDFDVKKCCSEGQALNYFEMRSNCPFTEIIILLVQLVIYMLLVVLTELGLFNGLCDRFCNSSYVPPPLPADTSEMVRAETQYVSKGITLPVKQIPDAMLVDKLHKNYVSCLKKFNAVKGVSFSVKKGECFGLLGVNGAGKSTTFKIITAEEAATRGRVYANEHHLQWPRGAYLRSLGYCPQFFGLDEFLTGKANLTLLLTIRGLNSSFVQKEVKTWIEVVGLEKYTNRLVAAYSGGCKRRLATAAALSVGAPLTMLDEPTAGVDVVARRRVWAALRRTLLRGRAVIITSHSMDEMEALCQRIAIMSGGVVRALGSPAALRAQHAQGHAVVIKIRSRRKEDVTDGPDSPVNNLKGKLMEKFNCSLRDEHKTMLHYHINETMRYSDLFTQLEGLRRDFPDLIEDYSVTETTLEEVFLSFAHDQDAPTHPGGGKPPGSKAAPV